MVKGSDGAAWGGHHTCAHRHRQSRGWSAVIAVIASAALLTACAAAGQDAVEHAGVPAQETVEKTILDADGHHFPTIDRDGMFLVWLDIPFGRYRTLGGADCRWARLASTDPGDIIEGSSTDGPQEVKIEADDTAFLTSHCGTWQLTSFY
jgi:hypothetical protein